MRSLHFPSHQVMTSCTQLLVLTTLVALIPAQSGHVTLRQHVIDTSLRIRTDKVGRTGQYDSVTRLDDTVVKRGHSLDDETTHDVIDDGDVHISLTDDKMLALIFDVRRRRHQVTSDVSVSSHRRSDDVTARQYDTSSAERHDERHLKTNRIRRKRRDHDIVHHALTDDFAYDIPERHRARHHKLNHKRPHRAVDDDTNQQASWDEHIWTDCQQYSDEILWKKLNSHPLSKTWRHRLSTTGDSADEKLPGQEGLSRSKGVSILATSVPGGNLNTRLGRRGSDRSLHVSTTTTNPEPEETEVKVSETGATLVGNGSLSMGATTPVYSWQGENSTNVWHSRTGSATSQSVIVAAVKSTESADYSDNNSDVSNVNSSSNSSSNKGSNTRRSSSYDSGTEAMVHNYSSSHSGKNIRFSSQGYIFDHSIDNGSNITDNSKSSNNNNKNNNNSNTDNNNNNNKKINISGSNTTAKSSNNSNNNSDNNNDNNNNKSNTSGSNANYIEGDGITSNTLHNNSSESSKMFREINATTLECYRLLTVNINNASIGDVTHDFSTSGVTEPPHNQSAVTKKYSIRPTRKNRGGRHPPRFRLRSGEKNRDDGAKDDRHRRRPHRQYDVASWHCQLETHWKRMPDGVFPPWVETGRCRQATCLMGMYECVPKRYHIQVLRRVDAACRPIASSSSSSLSSFSSSSSVDRRHHRHQRNMTSSTSRTRRHDAWAFADYSVIVGCDCSTRRKTGRFSLADRDESRTS